MSKIKLDSYQQFIAMSRYARFNPEEDRRETYQETCDRLEHFWIERFPEHGEIIKRCVQYTRDIKSMPSMRSLMTAGPALSRDNIAGYNCSFLPVDHPRAFDECLFILANGTGVGYSVERQSVSKLPRIAESFHETDSTIIISDSKIGWASGLRELVSLLYSGKVPKIDYSRVRAAGERLKIFGGRASGPEPLKRCYEFFIRTFRESAGGKLTSIQCHDLMCCIGECIVVGGVRRSACISLSNLSDERMRSAKSGQWWIDNGQRGLANNSVAYTERPEIGIFMKEWASLYESKSGERGIFNREAAEKLLPERREGGHEWGTNPCFTGDTLVAVADGRDPVTIEQLATENKDFEVYSGKHVTYGNQHGSSDKFSHWHPEIKKAIAFCTGTKEVVCVTLSNGDSFRCTPDHRLATADGGYIEAQHAEGVELARFFTRSHKNRRIINNSTNSYAKQSRLIWEFHNGPKPLGMEIDHIDNTSNDRLSNLQLLSRDDHLRKTSGERTGVNNPIHKVAKSDLSAWSTASSYGTRNPRFNGMSNDSILELARGIHARGEAVTIANLCKADSDVPHCFSGYRFGGIKNLRHIVENGLSWEEPEAPTYNVKQCDPAKQEERSVLVVSVEKTGAVEKVYDLTVEDNHNFYIVTSENKDGLEGVLVHNCSEIILRPHQFCNLTSVVVRPSDTLDDLLDKIEVATIMGTFQATLTSFRYLRKIWSENTVEEALLGVSLTGIADHRVMNGSGDLNELKRWQNTLRDKAVEVNKKWAKKLGINQAAAVTAVKPEGCCTLDTGVGIVRGSSVKNQSYRTETFEELFRNAGIDPLRIEPGTFIDAKDDVYVYDRNNDLKRIIKYYVNGFSEVYEIVDEFGGVHKVTDHHKFLTKDGWKKSDELETGNEIVSYSKYSSSFPAPRSARISSIRLLKFRRMTVDIEVEDTHSYQLRHGLVSHNTLSQLSDTSSGIHPRYSEYYIRTVRQDIKDPISTFLIKAGVPHEPCHQRPDSTIIFSFPIQSPPESIMRNDRSAIEQLGIWKMYQLEYCEHKPSITVYVKEHEWMSIGAWVYENFDIMSGVSFLPHSDHSYQQAPYQEIDEEEYGKAIKAFPNIDWDSFSESGDNTTSSQEFACVGGSCEI